jgi:hypothetical protein
MDATDSTSTPKLPLEDEGQQVVERFARWLRIAGGAQLALACVALALVGLTFGCGLMAAGLPGGPAAMLAGLIPVVIVGVFVLQAMRMQIAGEQFAEVASEGDLGSLEFGFARLRTVFIIDLVVGALLLVLELIGAVA